MAGDGEGIPLHRAASLLDWHEVGERHYAGGDYEISLIEPYRWEVRYRSEHVEFDESREASFLIAEKHHREVLRRRDMLAFGSIAVASAVGLVAMFSIERGTVAWVLVLAVLLFANVSTLMRFVLTWARIPYRRRYRWDYGKRRRKP